MPQITDNIARYIKNHKLITSRYMLHIHIAQMILLCSAIGISLIGVIIRDKSRPMSRANTIALGMGFKSLIFLAYQLLTEYTRRFRKWASFKANFVLNTLEIVFWAAVMGLTFQANLRFCSGAACGLSWVVAVLAAVLHMSYVYTSLVTWKEWRASKVPGGAQLRDREAWTKPGDVTYSHHHAPA